MQRPPPRPRLACVLVIQDSPRAAAAVLPALLPVRQRSGHMLPGPDEGGRLVTRSEAAAVPLQFEEFAAARGPALVRLARGLLRNPHNAEDVVQDVLAKALVKWGRISQVDDPDAYVRRMVVNASTSFWRRAVRREHPVEHERMPQRAVEDASADVAERERMLGLLRRLPAKQRAVLVLRHYEGLPDQEIADLLGSSTGTVRSNAHRGLASLRSMLAEDRVLEEGRER